MVYPNLTIQCNFLFDGAHGHYHIYIYIYLKRQKDQVLKDRGLIYRIIGNLM